MQEHERRVVAEREELDVKIVKLTDFINFNSLYGKLPVDEQARLQRQYSAMYQYSEILGERIAAFPK